MAVKELNAKEQHYADNLKEAEGIVTEAKEDMHLISWKINEKYNKYGTYFLVELGFSYNTPKEIMENARPNDVEDSSHEGVEYNVETDGTVSMNKENTTEEAE